MTSADFAYIVVHENVLELVPNILHQYFTLSVPKPVRSKVFAFAEFILDPRRQTFVKPIPEF
jgi:hypothetical protein